MNDQLFDEYNENYEEALQRGLSLTGDDSGFYARERVRWLAGALAKRGASIGRVLDFGCGTGSTTSVLLEDGRASSVTGYDVSEGLLARARADHSGPNVTYVSGDSYVPDGSHDSAYTNGVYHHIPPGERAGAAATVFQSLRRGGYYGFWENNPWNPGTRIVMSRVEFDRDAITLTPPESRALLRGAGFEIVDTSSRFYFPAALRFLRNLEPALSVLPLGGQYMVLARKP